MLVVYMYTKLSFWLQQRMWEIGLSAQSGQYLNSTKMWILELQINKTLSITYVFSDEISDNVSKSLNILFIMVTLIGSHSMVINQNQVT